MVKRRNKGIVGRFGALAVCLLALSFAGCDGCDGNVNDGGFAFAITLRASVSSAGTQGNAQSGESDVSGDGRYVVFSSQSLNLVPVDTNGGSDVFRHDHLTGVTELVSMNLAGTDSGNGASGNPAISANGRYVVFESLATDLVAVDANGATQDVFRRDMLTGMTELVSLDAGGGGSDGVSSNPDTSADGRFVAFGSMATDLVVGDGNGQSDVFRRDMLLAVTIRVSVTAAGGEATGVSFADPIGGSGNPSISADGSVIAFASGATNFGIDFPMFRDIIVRDLNTPTTERISIEDPSDPDGNPFDFGVTNGNSFNPSISADGRYVSFDSLASDLIPADANVARDVFVHDRVTDLSELVSRNSEGLQAVADSSLPSISGDGQFVVFESIATNLVVDDTNGVSDIFLRARAESLTERVSVQTFGVQTNPAGISNKPSLSRDGRFVVFESLATNLVNDDLNGVRDVFLRGPLR